MYAHLEIAVHACRRLRNLGYPKRRRNPRLKSASNHMLAALKDAENTQVLQNAKPLERQKTTDAHDHVECELQPWSVSEEEQEEEEEASSS